MKYSNPYQVQIPTGTITSVQVSAVSHAAYNETLTVSVTNGNPPPTTTVFTGTGENVTMYYNTDDPTLTIDNPATNLAISLNFQYSEGSGPLESSSVEYVNTTTVGTTIVIVQIGAEDANDGDDNDIFATVVFTGSNLSA